MEAPRPHRDQDPQRVGARAKQRQRGPHRAAQADRRRLDRAAVLVEEADDRRERGRDGKQQADLDGEAQATVGGGSSSEGGARPGLDLAARAARRGAPRRRSGSRSSWIARIACSSGSLASTSSTSAWILRLVVPEVVAQRAERRVRDLELLRGQLEVVAERARVALVGHGADVRAPRQTERRLPRQGEPIFQDGHGAGCRARTRAGEGGRSWRALRRGGAAAGRRADADARSRSPRCRQDPPSCASTGPRSGCATAIRRSTRSARPAGGKRRRHDREAACSTSGASRTAATARSSSPSAWSTSSVRRTAVRAPAENVCVDGGALRPRADRRCSGGFATNWSSSPPIATARARSGSGRRPSCGRRQQWKQSGTVCPPGISICGDVAHDFGAATVARNERHTLAGPRRRPRDQSSGPARPAPTRPYRLPGRRAVQRRADVQVQVALQGWRRRPGRAAADADQLRHDRRLERRRLGRPVASVASVVSYGYADEPNNLYGPYQAGSAQSLYDKAKGG